MGSDPRGTPEAEAAAAYGAHARALRRLARKLEVPPAEVEGLVQDALYASFLRKPNVEIGKWLAAVVTAAAKRYRERGE
jgi:DNA-directed RNA polymerase specialized sigma24 family protein